MEEILQQILKRFDGIDLKFEMMDQRFESIDKRFDAMDQKFDTMDSRLSSLEDGQKSLLSEQGEMRKEVAFYYGSLMKKLDESKLELSSELKHVSTIQKQHQDVLEILNERQQ